MTVTFKWTPEVFKAAMGQAIDKGLSDAALAAADIARRQLGKRHGGKPSKEGNPPNSQTGTLYRSHGWELKRPRVARYGVGVFYGAILENPARLNRPWLLIPIQRHKQRLNQRFTRSAVQVMKARAQ
jgi:hypothetical protein